MTKGHKESFPVMNIFGIDSDDGFMNTYISPDIKLYAINMGNSLYVNYTSINLFKT